MDTNENNILHKELSYKIVGSAMKVHNQLGYGFLEKVYENALMIVLNREGVKAEQQAPIKVYFKDEILENIMQTYWSKTRLS